MIRLIFCLQSHLLVAQSMTVTYTTLSPSRPPLWLHNLILCFLLKFCLYSALFASVCALPLSSHHAIFAIHLPLQSSMENITAKGELLLIYYYLTVWSMFERLGQHWVKKTCHPLCCRLNFDGNRLKKRCSSRRQNNY